MDSPHQPIDWKAYYNREHTLCRFVPEADPTESYRLAFVQSLLPRETFAAILDAGCGDGHQCNFLATRAARVVGSDVALPRLQYAQQHRAAPHIHFASSDLTRLPFKARSFDVVSLVEVLEHMADPVAILKGLATLSRRYLLVTVPYKQKPLVVLCPHCLQNFPVDGHLQMFDEPSFRAVLQTAGLRIVTLEHYFSPESLGERRADPLVVAGRKTGRSADVAKVVIDHQGQRRLSRRALRSPMIWPTVIRHRRCLARLRTALRTRPHTILLFHSVGRPASARFLPAGLDCDPELFEKVLRLLSTEAQVLSLGRLAERLQSGDLPARAAALTFDDGFRDNFTVVLPRLRHYRLPATVFVATDAVDKDELLPIHRYYYARQSSAVIDEPHDTPARRAAVDGFLQQRGVVVPPLSRELYLRRDEVRALAAEKIEIGAHTCSHPWLAAWPPAEQRREIVRSRELLEEWTGAPVTSFAYPYGYPDSFNEMSAAIVAENFPVACLSGEGGGGPRALPRVNIASL